MLGRAMERWRAVWSAGLRPGSREAFLFAIGCVAVATAVRIGIGVVSPDSAVFAPYYSSTLVAALVAGVAAGSLASLLGALAAYCLFVPEEWTFVPFVVEHVVSLLLYGASSIVIIWAAHSYRGLLRRIRHEETTRELLARELAHRIKNLLASVQAIVGQSLHDQPPEVMAKVRGRIAAFAATNDLLIRSEWHGASLRAILELECAPYGLARFSLRGEDIACPSEVAVWLALVVHELATNAAKHGALSRPHGRVAVSWSVSGDELALAWVESGGPSPASPMRAGFGTKLLDSGLRQFHGRVERCFTPTGLHCALSLRLAVAPGGAPAPRGDEAPCAVKDNDAPARAPAE